MLDPAVFSSSDEEERHARRRKYYKPRISYAWLENRTFEFNERFRMSVEKFESLSNILRPHLLQSREGGALSVNQIIEVALHWLGTGVQYHALGDMHGISKATVCRCLKKFIRAVNREILPRYVRFPQNMHTIVQRFHALANMPQVCGAVDGTLIKIDAPRENEADFVDRHGAHSINCMAVCGPDMQFYSVDAHWPGSTHDSRVLKNSRLWSDFENNGAPVPGGIILGDSAYGLRRWLITPIIRPAASPEEQIAQERFLRSHKRTRRVIECAFGILKEKFLCLNHLHVAPVYAARIFKCCVALCNFVRIGGNDEIRVRDFIENDDPHDNDNAEDGDPLPEDDNEEDGRAAAEIRIRQIYSHFL